MFYFISKTTNKICATTEIKPAHNPDDWLSEDEVPSDVLSEYNKRMSPTDDALNVVDSPERVQELCSQRIQELRSQLAELSNDFMQAYAGEIVPDLEFKKAKFRMLHNELRELLGLEPRDCKEGCIE